MFAKIKRDQLLCTTGWSDPDLSNRTHNNQMGLAFGTTLPAENGVYIGPDCFALRLADELVKAGFSWTQAGRFVLDYETWLRGLERIEHPDRFPPRTPTPFAPTQRGMDEGVPAYLDTAIYFAIAESADGEFRVACGTLAENLIELGAIISAAPAGTVIRHINLGWVYTGTLKAAEKAGVDLGAPFTRPDHPDHRDEHRAWFAAVEVHRALSFARQKVRKPPGPARAKGKQQRPARAPACKLVKV